MRCRRYDSLELRDLRTGLGWVGLVELVWCSENMLASVQKKFIKLGFKNFNINSSSYFVW